jgi:hypothetical protein
VYRPGLDAKGGKKSTSAPHPSLPPNMPPLLYPGERESILHSGSADGSTDHPLPTAVSLWANGFSYMSGELNGLSLKRITEIRT